jgi:hypothetical protein
MLLSTAVLCLSFAACSSDDNKTEPTNTDKDAAAGQDTALAKCPDEVDLKTLTLPCDCYGHEANETTIVFPDCKSQVVCCPSISDLRCEDHEMDAAVDAPAEAEVPDVKIPNCPIEKDLSKVALPCMCYDTLVEDPAESMPDCQLTVVCCPGTKDLKCE